MKELKKAHQMMKDAMGIMEGYMGGMKPDPGAGDWEGPEVESEQNDGSEKAAMPKKHSNSPDLEEKKKMFVEMAKKKAY